MSNNFGVISGSDGNFLILFVRMLIVRVVQHGNMLRNTIKFLKFPPLPEITPERTQNSELDMRGPRPLAYYVSRFLF